MVEYDGSRFAFKTIRLTPKGRAMGNLLRIAAMHNERERESAFEVFAEQFVQLGLDIQRAMADRGMMMRERDDAKCRVQLLEQQLAELRKETPHD